MEVKQETFVFVGCLEVGGGCIVVGVGRFLQMNAWLLLAGDSTVVGGWWLHGGWWLVAAWCLVATCW